MNKRTIAALPVMAFLATLPLPAAHADTVLLVPGSAPHPVPSKTVNVSWLNGGGWGTTAEQIGYPAGLAPFEGSMPVDPSTDIGQQNLDTKLRAVVADKGTGEPIEVITISQGGIVEAKELAYLKTHPLGDVSLTFVDYADPASPTGIMGSNAGLKLPGYTFVQRPETPYNTTYVVRQYDGISDWPQDETNILADLNALMGAAELHNQVNYDAPLSSYTPSQMQVTTTTNSLGGVTTVDKILTPQLPLLDPLRKAGVNPVITGNLNKALKPIVDSAYKPLTPQQQAGKTATLHAIAAVSDAAVGTAKTQQANIDGTKKAQAANIAGTKKTLHADAVGVHNTLTKLAKALHGGK